MDPTDPYTIIGLTGMILILFGIWRTSSGRWHHSTLWYELDTIIGASLIIIYQLNIKAYVTLPINIVLVFISFRGLSSFAERYAKVKAHKLNKNKRKTSKKR